MSSPMFLSYDRDADAISVKLRAPQGEIESEPFGDRCVIDYDETGEPVAVELLFVSRGIELEGVPEAEGIREMLTSLGKLTA